MLTPEQKMEAVKELVDGGIALSIHSPTEKTVIGFSKESTIYTITYYANKGINSRMFDCFSRAYAKWLEMTK
jgi:hypothetical protein